VLLKRDTTGRFDESKVNRDDDGRFASKGGAGGTAPSLRQSRLVEGSPGRLFEEKWGRSRAAGLFSQGKSTPPGIGHNTRSSWERLGNKIAALPPEYTGSKNRENPVDGYRTFAVTWQRPKQLTPKQNEAVRLGLVSTIKANRDGAIERATERGLIGDDVPRRLVNRAYNLAAMRAMHEFGVLAFDYSMGEDLKREMAPLEPAMRFFQRRIGDRMRADPATKGKWQPYKEEFGIPYANGKLDRRPGKGNQVRLKWPKSQGQHTQFVKAVLPGALAKRWAMELGVATSLVLADQILAQARARDAAPRHSGILTPEVAAMMPVVNRILAQAASARQAAAPDRIRHRASGLIRNPGRSLAELLG
jgi:hypothetical protein